MKHVDEEALEEVLLQRQEQIRGPVPKDEWMVIDGKPPRQGGGPSVLTAITVPSQHYLGSAVVDTKTNEIPVARQLFQKLDLDGRKVSLEALHTQAQTARALVLEHGADSLLSAKDNQPTLRKNMERRVGGASGAFFPPRQTTPTLAGQREINKGQPELRLLRSGAASLEAVGFPLVAQVALLRRHLRQQAPEVVALITSLPPSELTAAPWLAYTRAAWGIESGLHQRDRKSVV